MGKKIGRILLSVILSIAFVISFIPYGAYAAETVTADEKNEINRLINQFNSMQYTEIVVEDGDSVFIISQRKDGLFSLTHQLKDGKTLHTTNCYYDPYNPDAEITVVSDVIMGSTGVMMEATTNITKNDYCSDANSISFEVTSSSYTLSESLASSYKKAAASAFRLLISKIRLELATKYSIDLKKLGFRSISSLLPEKKTDTDKKKTDTSKKQTEKKGTWKQDKNGWWYAYSGGSYAKSTWLKIKGKWYFFAANGYMAKGWKKVGGKWYYLGTNGVMRTGWQKLSGKWYYFGTDGIMGTGWKKAGGKWYYLGTNGVMRTGWQKVSGKWYYLGTNGVMRTGWQKIGGKWYYLGTDGAMKKSWQKIGGKWYFFDTNGVMVTGKRTIDGVKYTFRQNGELVESTGGNNTNTSTDNKKSVAYTGNPIVFSGSGTSVISSVQIPKGLYKVTLHYEGEHNFIVVPYDATGDRKSSLANEIGDYDGSVIFDEDINGGYIQVKSSGDWIISFEAIENNGTSSIEGEGDWVSPFFKLKNGALVVNLSNVGAHNFIVIVYDEYGNRYSSLANEIGNYNGQVIFDEADSNTRYCIEVTSSGEWSVDFGLGASTTELYR